MIRFEGGVRALAPLTVTYPGLDGLPRTPHDEVVLYAGTFRGPLRKACLRAVRREIARARGVGEDQVFSLADVYMLGEGVDVTRAVLNESKAHTDPAGMAQLREINPLLSVFGRWRLPGRLAVGELRAPLSCLTTSGAGARADHFERDTDEIEYLSAEERDSLRRQLESEHASVREIDVIQDEIRELTRQRRASEDQADRRDLSKKIDEARARIKEKKSEREGAQESIRHPLEGYEAIAAGTELSHRLTLTSDSTDELGVVLAGMAEFAREPMLGGHRARGCGEFEARYTVKEWPSGELSPREIGSVSFGPEGVQVQGEALESAYSQFLKRLEGDGLDFSVYALEHLQGR